MSAIQSEVQKPGDKLGELVPQSHGGTLWRGPSPNHVPGPGRPSLRAKAKAAANAEAMLDILIDQARGVSADGATIYPTVRQSAAKAVLDIGIPKEVITHTVEHRVAGILESVARVLASELGIETRDHLLTLIQQDVKDNAEVSTSVSQDVETQ